MLLIKKTFTLFFVSMLILPALHAQRIAITGKVTDNNGRPIPAASVQIKSSQSGTSTDTLGAFSLRARANDSLIVSAVGYSDTSVLAGNRTFLDIVLQPRSAALNEAVVTGATPGGDNRLQATTADIVTNAFQEWSRSAEFSEGAYHISSSIPGHASNIFVRGFGPLNTLSSGTALPVIEHKEETKGSRYLLKGFAYGVVVDNTGKVIADSLHLLNYDKIDGQLMIAQGANQFLEVDKDKVAAFAFKTPDTSFIFLNVPILSKINYFILVATGPRYSVYKSIHTKFIKSNYVSNGLTESGNNYDEYLDTQTYFWVAGKDSAGVFELKKKSIKTVFVAEKNRVDDYFSQHKLDDIDDHFIKGLVDYLNKP
jgi:hypothetical protein